MLPKGKLIPHESLQQAALREVHEETGCVGNIDDYAGTIAYEVNQIPKVVCFWRMRIVAEGAITDHHEVDRTEWVSPAVALERLTHSQERSLIARLFPYRSHPYNSPGDVELKPWNRRWSWSRGERAHARLLREFEAFRIELAYRQHQSEKTDNAWAQAARDQLDKVKQFLENRDIEGGWYCLHAARRMISFGMTTGELEDQASVIRAEVTKLTSWRGAAINELLAIAPLTPERLCAAMALRDEYAGNHYHKIWLMADQLGVLLWISGGALIFLVICLVQLPATPGTWDYRLVFTILFAGILGATFSAAQSLISNANPAKIPERVSNHFVTIIRSLFGGTAGLAGYVFLKSKLFNITIGDDGTAAALAIAFLFGYTGERLIARIAESVSKERDRT